MSFWEYSEEELLCYKEVGLYLKKSSDVAHSSEIRDGHWNLGAVAI